MSSNLFNSYVPRESNSKIAIVLGVASLCLILISTMSDLSESMSNNLSLLILVVSLLLCFLIQMSIGKSEHFEEEEEKESELKEDLENDDNGSEVSDDEKPDATEPNEYFSLQENFDATESVNDSDSDDEENKEHFQGEGAPSDTELPEPTLPEPTLPEPTLPEPTVPDATSARYDMTNNPDTEGNESQMIKAGENQNNSILDIDNLSDAEKAIAKAAREEMNKIRARRQETAKQQYLQGAKELKEKEEALKKVANWTNKRSYRS